jgi:NADPH:quinone reductase-like Zn-dependent oxidoreductase
VDRVFPLGEAALAHAYVEANRNLGKVVLEMEMLREGGRS